MADQSDTLTCTCNSGSRMVADQPDTLSPTCDSSGRMVVPAWPPTTGMDTSFGSVPVICPMNALARTTSSFVTPSTFFGSYVPGNDGSSLLSPETVDSWIHHRPTSPLALAR